jgi:hypothetical protein
MLGDASSLQRRVVAVSCCALFTCLVASRHVFAQDQPRALGSPSVQADRSNGAGTALLFFRNDSAKPMEVVLSTGPVTASGTSKATDAQVFFGAESETGPGVLEYKFSLSPSSTAKVKVFVTNAWGISRMDADLLNRSTRIAKLAILPFAMNVSLLDPAPDKAELDLTDGSPARIILKNEDSLSYALTFRLIVGGRQLAGHDFRMPPQGSALLEFVPKMPSELTSPGSYVPAILGRLQEIFKPEVHKGDVLYLYQKEGNTVDYSSPAKIISLSTSFNYFSPEWRTALNYILIVGILILGAITSLTFGHAVPNLLQRLNIVEQLKDLAKNIANLSSNIDSRLAVLIRLERSRLNDLLKSRSTISPDFDTIVAQCNAGVGKLSARVALCQQMDIVMGKLSQFVRAGAPPSQIYDIRRSQQQAGETLKKVDAPETDLQDTNKSIAAAGLRLDSINRLDLDFGKALAQRVQDVCANVIKPMAAKPTFANVNTAVPSPSSVLQAVPATTTEIDASLYTSVDTALWKIQIIREYVEFAEGTSDAQIKARLQKREGQLTSYLNVQSWEALCSARLLLQEMKEDLYPERLHEALTASPAEASISMEPAIAYEEEPLDFSVRFSNTAINTARAREEWVCSWAFGDGLHNEGWLVSHYFILPKRGVFRVRKSQVFEVAASFQDAAGKQVTDSAGKPIILKADIKVQPSRLRSLLGERALAEVARLSIAILIAVFGLVAGVKDQIVKLDILPGLAAVFLAGYGVDALKNLMSSNKNS